MATKTVAAPKRSRVPKRLPNSVSTSAPAGMIGASAAGDADAFRRDAPGFEGGVLSSIPCDREPSTAERRRMVRLSRLNYKRSGVYGQVVDTLANFVVGDGVVTSFDSPAVGKFVSAVLDDPRNGWHRSYRERIIDLLVDGEFTLSATVPVRGLDGTMKPIPTAAVLFGRMDLEELETIQTARYNRDRILSLGFREEDNAAREVEELPIAVPGVRMKHDVAENVLRSVFLWQVNKLGKRGLPYLSRSLDKATMLDAVVEELARKAEYTSRFWLHATYVPAGDKSDAKTEAKLLAWLKSWTPGEAAVTTDGVKVIAVAPDLKLPDAAKLVEVLLEYILGSHGIPRMWYSAGGDTNRATAVEQGTPIHRAIDALQTLARSDYEDVVRFVVWIGKQSGAIPSDDPEGFRVTMADVATRDSQRDVDEVSGLVAALDAAVASEILSPIERQRAGRAAIRGKSFGDVLTDATAPKITPDVGLAPVPPGAIPGFGIPPAAPPLPTPLVPAPAPAPGS